MKEKTRETNLKKIYPGDLLRVINDVYLYDNSNRMLHSCRKDELLLCIGRKRYSSRTHNLYTFLSTACGVLSTSMGSVSLACFFEKPQ